MMFFNKYFINFYIGSGTKPEKIGKNFFGVLGKLGGSLYFKGGVFLYKKAFPEIYPEMGGGYFLGIRMLKGVFF